MFRPTNGPPTPKTTSVPWYTRREGERWRYARNTSYILDVLFAIPIALSLSTINAREMSWTMFPMVFFMSMMLACPLAILWGCMAWTGAYIAEQKGRERYEGVLFSVFLGPIGMLIEACLPDETRRAE